MQDEIEQHLVVAVVEGQVAADHLVHDNADTPPVHRATVVVVLEHLRGQVFRGPAKGRRRSPECDFLLAQPKVGDLDVALAVEQQVLQLEVAVDDAAVVQVCDGLASRESEKRKGRAEVSC